MFICFDFLCFKKAPLSWGFNNYIAAVAVSSGLASGIAGVASGIAGSGVIVVSSDIVGPLGCNTNILGKQYLVINGFRG